ncbi:MAG: LuxR C-terminal-related transcriptional regulator [Planctomycetales bacterium]
MKKKTAKKKAGKNKRNSKSKKSASKAKFKLISDSPPNAESLNKLSRRELEVLHGIVMDWPNEDVCRQMGITMSTFSTHRKNILNKLQVRSSVGMTRVAIREGLVKP